MATRLIQGHWIGRKSWKDGFPWGWWTGLVSGGLAVVSSVVVSSTTRLDNNKNNATENKNNPSPFSYQIDVNFMERLANKAYLHFTEHDSRPQRPVGVPNTLRILTVDLPEVSQHGFRGGQCTVDATKIYPDGIADSVHVSTKKGGKHALEVEQKAWVKSMTRCIAQGTQKVAVEIMEADVTRLNPNNMRRIHHYGTLHYDPGKYTEKEAAAQEDADTDRSKKRRKDRKKRKNDTDNDDQDKLLENEREAPWHQNAWKEEALLRISGQVGFGEALQETTEWTRRIFGYQYQATIRPSTWQSLYQALLFWRSRPSVHEGVDGAAVPCQASSRPHAVIANGLALQGTPHALRVLQKLCDTHNVPLFVIRDPRSWGGNTHPDDLGQVLRDLQHTVKQQIIRKSLQHSAGTAFGRGRLVGRLEEKTKWQAQEVLRQSKEIAQRALDNYRQLQQTNWSGLSEEELEKKLVYHGLLNERVEEDVVGGDDGGATTHRKELIDTLVHIVAKYGPTKDLKGGGEVSMDVADVAAAAAAAAAAATTSSTASS